MASPAVVGTPSESATTTDATSHTINRPTGVAGQLSILLFAFDGGTAVNVTAFSEETYTEFFRQDNTTSFGVIGYYRWEDATEDTSFTITTDDLEKSCSILYSISGAANPATQVPEAVSNTGASSTTKDPPSITPTGGSKDYLFIAGFADDGEEANDDTWHNTSSTGYTPSPGVQTTTGTAGVGTVNASLATFSRQLTAASEDPSSVASATDAAHISCQFTIAVHPAGAQTVDGVVLTTTPSLPTGLLNHTVTGVVLTVTPTLPTGTVEETFPVITGWDEAGRFWTDKASEAGLYPAVSDTISEVGVLLRDLAVAGGQTVTGVVLTVTPSLPTGSLSHSLTGVVLTATPSLPVGKLNHSLTGVVVTATPSLPTGALQHRLTGVAITVTPSLPVGALKHTITGTVLTATPTLPTGQVTTPGAQTVTGVVLTITPTLPIGSLSHSLTGVVLTATPSLPIGKLNHSLTGVVVTATPSLPTGTVNRSITGIAITVTPSLPVGALRHTVTGIVLTVTPTLPVGQVTVPGAQTVTGTVLTVTPVLPIGTVAFSSILGVVVTITPVLPVGVVTTEAIGVPVKGPTYGRSLIGNGNDTEELAGAPRAALIGAGSNSLEEV